MKIVQLYGIILCLLVSIACNRDNVDDVKFNVSIDSPANIQAGKPVTFRFDGNADYITFFSGEPGNCYSNILRDSVTIASMQLECTIKQQYTDNEYRLKEIVHAYISEDFNGEYTLENIQKATWQKVSGLEHGQIAVPLTQNNTTEEVSSIVDWSRFTNKQFYIAFQYNAFKRNNIPAADGNGRYHMQPRVDINPLKLTRVTNDGIQMVWENAKTDFGFRVIYQNSTQQSNYQVK